MVDLEDLSSGDAGLACDRAIFTSLPSPTGEGYRLVAWSSGVKSEERVELTRRAPSHGSLCGEEGTPRGTAAFRLASSGRLVHAVVRVSGAEHTRRGGGRVWTDFLLAHAGETTRFGLAPEAWRAALEAQAKPKPPLGSSALAPVLARTTAPGEIPARSARAIADAAGIASVLGDGATRVIAAGALAAQLFEDALAMLPAGHRPLVEACGGLRFTAARGVKTTVTDRIDAETIRATRGQGIETIDLSVKPLEARGPLLCWFSLMRRWWAEGRSCEARALADGLTGAWTAGDVLEAAALGEALDRGGAARSDLSAFLQRKTAA